jgi:hypothetical protein
MTIAIAKKTREPSVQKIGLKHITIDHEIQSRVAMDMGAAQEFSQAIIRGDVFPPVDVFHDNGVYLLADGFHRYEAHHHAGKTEIRCTVHQGDRRDALIFSAGANKAFSLKRSTADVHKAICMLLEDSEWFHRNDAQIAHHVGCSAQTVWRVRQEYCKATEQDPPTKFIDTIGRLRPARRKFSVASRVAYLQGQSEEEAPTRHSLDYSSVRDLFVRKFDFQAVVDVGQWMAFPGIKVVYRPTPAPVILLTPCDFVLTDSLPLAVGRLLLARQIVRRADRLVVLCYPDDGPVKTMACAKDLDVEFISPEEMIKSLKA